MKIIKRNGAEVTFDKDKIVMAVTKANDAVDDKYRMTALQIQRITDHVQISCEQMGLLTGGGKAERFLHIQAPFIFERKRYLLDLGLLRSIIL